MKKYRIVSNGIDFRIQRLGKTFFFRRPKWKWIKVNTYAGDYIPEYLIIAEAQNALNEAERVDLAIKRGYTLVC
ncbi:MAG TPA: hypothetical protein ENH82_06930 [bacterium]|nr:hypothetical protein [bacterium]